MIQEQSKSYKCRHCSCQIAPTENQIKKGNFICRSCTSTYMKAWRKQKKAAGIPYNTTPVNKARKREYQLMRMQEPEYRARINAHMRRYSKNPILAAKKSARRKLRDAVKTGAIVKTACFTCGELKVEAHHADYSMPLSVIWLCKQHHMAAHALVKKYKARKGGE